MRTSQAHSRPAQLLHIASWVIAVLFAVFLNMLGSLVMRDMVFVPRGGPPALERFVDSGAVRPLDAKRRELQQERDTLAGKIDSVSIARVRAGQDYQAAKETFRNWVSSRSATGQSAQDAALLEQTHKLDDLQASVVNWQRQQDALTDQQRQADANLAQVKTQLAQRQSEAEQRYEKATRQYELTVFAWRLSFTLPILLLAIWLVIRFRKARYWPFVYGFALFALSTFFVELVPYLPTFGGYVRVIVGIVLTIFVGIYILRAFQRYVERKHAEMQQSEGERARAIGYDKAISAYQKKLCPSCDKPWNLGGDGATFCIHCGLKLFLACNCGARNYAFFPFCNECGKPVERQGEVSVQ